MVRRVESTPNLAIEMLLFADQLALDYVKERWPNEANPEMTLLSLMKSIAFGVSLH